MSYAIIRNEKYIGEVPELISSKYAQKQIIEPFKEENLKLIEQNIYI